MLMAEIYGGSERAVLGVAEKLLSNRLRVARSSLKGSEEQDKKEIRVPRRILDTALLLFPFRTIEKTVTRFCYEYYDKN